jgi:hypothetical protein
MNTYTLVYKSTPRNLALAAQAALMKSRAPTTSFVPVWTVMGVDLISDTPTTSAPHAVRTVVLRDSATPGVIPPGQVMATTLTKFMEGAIATGIKASIISDPVAIT